MKSQLCPGPHMKVISAIGPPPSCLGSRILEVSIWNPDALNLLLLLLLHIHNTSHQSVQHHPTMGWDWHYFYWDPNKVAYCHLPRSGFTPFKSRPHHLKAILLSIPNVPQRDQIRSVAQSCPTLCDPMNRSTPGLPVHHQLLEFTQTHVQRVRDAIQPSHALLSPSPLAPNPSQHQSLFQWVNSSHEVAQILEFQL